LTLYKSKETMKKVTGKGGEPNGQSAPGKRQVPGKRKKKLEVHRRNRSSSTLQTGVETSNKNAMHLRNRKKKKI